MPEAEAPGVWPRVKRVLHAIGSFQADVLLSIVYYLALGPAAILLKLSGNDPFGLKNTGSGWAPRENIEPGEHLKSQG